MPVCHYSVMPGLETPTIHVFDHNNRQKQGGITGASPVMTIVITSRSEPTCKSSKLRGNRVLGLPELEFAIDRE